VVVVMERGCLLCCKTNSMKSKNKKNKELQTKWIIYLCDWVTDNVVDEVATGRCVVAMDRLGRGMSGADVELLTPAADSRGNGGWRAPPADNCAMAADSWLVRGVARPVLGGANTIAAAAGPVLLTSITQQT